MLLSKEDLWGDTERENRHNIVTLRCDTDEEVKRKVELADTQGSTLRASSGLIALVERYLIHYDCPMWPKGQLIREGKPSKPYSLKICTRGHCLYLMKGRRKCALWIALVNTSKGYRKDAN